VGRSAGAHTRINRGILAGSEKRLLGWLAVRMPRWIGSDHLTALGFLGMLGAAAAFAAARSEPSWPVLVIGGLAVNWFGDSLDGTLARVRRVERPRYGYYVDHVLDVTGTVALLGGLALSGLMSPLAALGFLTAFLAVEAERFLATHSVGVFRMSFLGVGPTELRILLAIGAVAARIRNQVHLAGHGPYLLFDVGGVVGMAGLAVAFFAGAIRTGRILYLEERGTLEPGGGGGGTQPSLHGPGKEAACTPGT
jgi:phosphatidylglycerophosphate synthase